VTSPAGFQAGALHAGLKSDPAKPDLALIVSDRPCSVAGTFTSNLFAAAPVQLDRERVSSGQARAIVANSGNANACTGERGLADARQVTRWAAEKLAIPEREVLVASTGIIGHHLPIERIRDGLARLELSSEGGILAAQGIMTTDTVPKYVAVEFESGGRPVRIGGIAKGAAMIHPNMGTMLCFLSTVAASEPRFLQDVLLRAVGVSFNMITVDGDMSTNDTCLLLANGASGVRVDGGGEPSELFQEALAQVTQVLAQGMVDDAEGSKRTMRVEILGAPSEQDARMAARAVAASNLTKAALHGGDPNWGRILCAVGYSGAKFRTELVELQVGRVTLVKEGSPLEFDQRAAAEAMRQPRVEIVVDLHQGSGRAVAWGCELTEEYVYENSAYST
jgi:glutamate N-acetyltransferase/amino-acid N-acetyltransferase